MINKLAFKLGVNRHLPGLMPLLNVGRMEPSFFVIGFQKCGTTTLWHALLKMDRFKRGILKENDMLSRKNCNMDEFRMTYPYKQRGCITGDFSHLNTFAPHGLDHIKKHFPKARIVVIMRNPVDRAFSHFNMDKKHGYLPEKLDFETYIDMEMRLRESLSNPDDVKEVYHGMKLFSSRYGWAISKGVYNNYLRDLESRGFSYHPIILERLHEDYEGEMQDFFDYIGLEGDVPEYKQSNKGVYRSELGDETRQRLEAFYAPYNDALSKRINQNLPW